MALSIRFLYSHHHIFPTHVAAVCNVSMVMWSKVWVSSRLIAGIEDPSEGVSAFVVCRDASGHCDELITR